MNAFSDACLPWLAMWVQEGAVNEFAPPLAEEHFISAVKSRLIFLYKVQSYCSRPCGRIRCNLKVIYRK